MFEKVRLQPVDDLRPAAAILISGPSASHALVGQDEIAVAGPGFEELHGDQPGLEGCRLRTR
jgi:hypothetical protein